MPERQRQEKLTWKMKNDTPVMNRQSLVQLHLENADDAKQGVLVRWTKNHWDDAICVMICVRKINIATEKTKF